MHDQVKCRTLFATHYHELTRLAGRLDCAVAPPRPRARVEGRPRPAPRSRRRRRRPQLRHRRRQARRAAAGGGRARASRCSPSSKRAATRPAGSPPGSTICRLFAAAAEPEHAPDPLAAALDEIEPDSLTPARGARAALSAEAARGRARADEPARRSTIGARSSTAARSPTGSPACAGQDADEPRPRRSCARRSQYGRAEIAAAARGGARQRPRRRAGHRLPARPARPARLRFRHRAAARRATGRPWRWSASAAPGRGEMAPFSDLDLMFLTAKAPTARAGARGRSDASSAVGPEAQGRPFGPLDRAADRAGQEGHDHPHRLPRGALAVGRREAVRRRDAPLPQGGRRRHRRRVRRRQARRARRAARQDGRQPLCRRAQRQGRQGRPSRPPHALLDRQICPRRRATRPTSSAPACSPPPSSAASTAPSASSGRCAATCTCSPGAPRSG